MIDTLVTARTLKEAGMPEPQTEAVATAVAAVADARSENFATKADVAGVKSELLAEMAALETRLTVRIVTLAIATSVAICGVIIAAMQFIFG